MKTELVKLARHRLERAKAAFSEGDHLLKAKGFMGAPLLLCGFLRCPRAFGAVLSMDTVKWARTGKPAAHVTAAGCFGGLKLIGVLLF